MSKIIKKIIKFLLFPLYIYAAIERVFAFILSVLFMFALFAAPDLNIAMRIILLVFSILAFLYSIGKLNGSGADGGSGDDGGGSD